LQRGYQWKKVGFSAGSCVLNCDLVLMSVNDFKHTGPPVIRYLGSYRQNVKVHLQPVLATGSVWLMTTALESGCCSRLGCNWKCGRSSLRHPRTWCAGCSCGGGVV
jgi:hypothetical protein